MEPPSADSIVLVAGPGPEVLWCLMVLAVALIGIGVSIMMARRGRIEAWSLVGAFGLAAFASVIFLAYVPTRLVLDRNGARLAFWGIETAQPWRSIQALELNRGPFGMWARFRMQDAGSRLVWTRWPGLLVPDGPVDPRQLTMRIEAWRMSNQR